MTNKITCLFLQAGLIVLILAPAAPARTTDFPKVLSIKDRVELVNRITLKRLDTLVPNSCFTVEPSLTMPVAEWGGKELRLSLEQDIVFDGEKAHSLDGRQTSFHLIK